MRWTIFLILGLLAAGLLITHHSARASETIDSLWQKAIAVGEANRDWVPGVMLSTVETLDDQGKPKGVKQTWMRFSLGPDGQIKTELTKALEDGKDVTAAEQARSKAEQAKKRDDGKKGEKSGGITLEFGSGDHIFGSATAATTSVKPLGEKKTLGDKRCVSYTFTQKRKEGETLEGTAWLEEGTGVPARVQYAPRPLPKHTKKMQTTIDYEYSPEGSWYARSYTVEGSGGFLWIKKTMRIRIEFSEYWRKGREGETGQQSGGG